MLWRDLGGVSLVDRNRCRYERMQCGALMVRYFIDGHELLLPCDAKLHPRIASDATIEELERDLASPFGGTY